jgi:type II secretory pathway component PulF
MNKEEMLKIADSLDAKKVEVERELKSVTNLFVVMILLIVGAILLSGVVWIFKNTETLDKHKQVKTELAELKTSSEIIVKSVNLIRSEKGEEKLEYLSEVIPELAPKMRSLDSELYRLENKLRFKTFSNIVQASRWLSFGSWILGAFFLLLALLKVNSIKSGFHNFLINLVRELVKEI